jgi:signal transduction histidine kinase
MLAHELGNPLAPVRNSIEILKFARNQPEALERARDTMDRQVAKLTHIVDDLLDISRINSGKIELRKERIDLRTLMTEVIDSARSAIETRGLSLSVSLANPAVYIDADRIRLEQVISNVLDNAQKYTENGGSIEVQLKRDGGHAVVRVRDSGIGIAPEVLPHVFELFTQADSALSRTRGGLGIGLSLVRQLVEMHGGSVTASSPGLGRGSEFVVRLPQATGPVAPESEKPASSAPEPAPRRILIVDDSVDSAETLAQLLRLHDHTVEVVFNGSAALETVDTFARTPFCSISDCRA